MTKRAISYFPKDSSEIADLLFDLGGRKAILVEGDTDFKVFRYWYSKEFGEKLVFYACKKEGGGKGCVKSRLEKAREVNIPAYGIIDRDFCDDATVQASLNDPASRLFILSRHCIENYILEPDFVESVLENAQSKSLASDQMSVEQRMLDICRKLKTTMAINWVFIESAAPKPFGEGHELLEREQIIKQGIKKAKGEKNFLNEDELRQRIQEKEELIEQNLMTLDSAHKYTDGKYLLFQTYHHYKMGLDNHGIFFNFLVEKIKDKSPHQDIRDIIERRILGRT
jgi:hypothetical protein